MKILAPEGASVFVRLETLHILVFSCCSSTSNTYWSPAGLTHVWYFSTWRGAPSKTCCRPRVGASSGYRSSSWTTPTPTSRPSTTTRRSSRNNTLTSMVWNSSGKWFMSLQNNSFKKELRIFSSLHRPKCYPRLFLGKISISAWLATMKGTMLIFLVARKTH